MPDKPVHQALLVEPHGLGHCSAFAAAQALYVQGRSRLEGATALPVTRHRTAGLWAGPQARVRRTITLKAAALERPALEARCARTGLGRTRRLGCRVARASGSRWRGCLWPGARVDVAAASAVAFCLLRFAHPPLRLLEPARPGGVGAGRGGEGSCGPVCGCLYGCLRSCSCGPLCARFYGRSRAVAVRAGPLGIFRLFALTQPLLQAAEYGQHEKQHDKDQLEGDVQPLPLSLPSVAWAMLPRMRVSDWRFSRL
jgi:hypothetical protein